MPSNVAQEIMEAPLEARVDFLRKEPKLKLHLVKTTGTPYFIWQDSPVEFMRDVLHENGWSGQNKILQSLWDNQRTAVKASHGVGKTHIAARGVAWWISTRPWGAATVVTTAPTWRQVSTLLWPHIRRLRADHNLPGSIGLAPQWKINDHLAAYGISPRDNDEAGAQGIHASYPMVVIDEAGGISKNRFKALEAVMSTGFGRILAIGNPATDDEDTAFEERWYSAMWNGMTVSAWDTPLLQDPPEVTPPCTCMLSQYRDHQVSEHLTQPEWVEGVREDYGEDSPYWIARVDAEFPHGVTARTIPVSWVEAAMDRDAPTEVSDQASLGVDVAADGGDELAIAVALGLEIRFLEGRSGEANANPLEVARRIKDHIEGADVGWEGLISAQRRLNPNKRAVVKIDAIGLGWGVAGILIAWSSEFMWPVTIVPVQVSEKPNTLEGQRKYLNKRAEMWWSARELIRDVVALRCDKRVLAQLSGPKYATTSSGKTQIEAKASLRARGLPSPDRAEAMLLAMYQEGWAKPATTSGTQVAQAVLPGVRRGGRQQPGGQGQRPGGWG